MKKQDYGTILHGVCECVCVYVCLCVFTSRTRLITGSPAIRGRVPKACRCSSFTCRSCVVLRCRRVETNRYKHTHTQTRALTLISQNNCERRYHVVNAYDSNRRFSIQGDFLAILTDFFGYKNAKFLIFYLFNTQVTMKTIYVFHTFFLCYYKGVQ